MIAVIKNKSNDRIEMIISWVFSFLIKFSKIIEVIDIKEAVNTRKRKANKYEVIFDFIIVSLLFKVMNEYLIVLLKCLIFYFSLILVMKLMGKREVGQLSIFDMAVFFVISDLFSLSIDSGWNILLRTVLVTFIMCFLQVITSFVILKCEKVRNVVEHIPTILIKNGKINQKTMAKQRYNIDDLMSQLRSKGFSSLNDIKYAILEANGELSIINKSECKCFPFPLIKDGNVDFKALNELGYDKQWLMNKLNGKKIENIFLAILENDKLIIIEKSTINIEKAHQDMDNYSN